MSPLDSRRESGTADPAAAEVNQNTPDKATTPVDSDTKATGRGGGAKKSLKQKQPKKHSGSKSTRSKRPRKVEVSESDSETNSDDDVSSSDDSDEEDSGSESELEQRKSKRSSKTARGSKRALQLKRQKRKLRAKNAQTHESDSEDDENSEPSGESDDDGDDTIDNSTRGDTHVGRGNRQGRQQSAKQQLQLNDLQQLQQLMQLMSQNQQLSTPDPSARLVPSGAGQGLTADPTGQTRAQSQNPLLQSLINTQLTQILQGSGDQAGRRSNRLPDGQALGRSGRRRGDAARKRNANTDEAEAAGDGHPEFKRVDQVWDSSIHNYKLKDTTQSPVSSKYEGYVFHVRRTFDWEGKYKTTFVDIKSKFLRDCLRDVIGNIKGVSLVEETPKLDPNMLFLYLDDLRKHVKALKKGKPGGSSKKERKREEKRIDMQRRHLKVLVKYLDKDYAEVKKSLLPMLDNGLITFDLLWALWKPGTLVYTSTYGCHDEPRAFKIDGSEKHFSMMRGDFYWVGGKYFEYDGKQFGYGNTSVEIPDFQGARKITSLPCYPLQFHKNEARVRETLIERGKKFSRLSGVHYKSHQGMAFYKRKKAVVKVNINGRVMVDPSIHRRINPNYQASIVRPKDHEAGSEVEGSDDDDSDCYCYSESEGNDEGSQSDDGQEGLKFVTKLIKDKSGKLRLMKVLKEDAEGDTGGKLDSVTPKDGESDTKVDTEDASEATEVTEAPPVPEFSDEEYLIASPVVLGFAFSEKLWLEFTVSGIREIQWNEGAYDSLVLEPKTKDIVKALVESHKYHAAESIDDVIQGKGKGLVAVLHGPPGTGKTLTAEGISELLKCPLYMASAGELGTDSRLLEGELQKILDICHAWGAILLLDEADVFLEKRNMHDIHRNALVSIFLRQLEYFQGILFLTTNRVETFDDAFQSRIHIALRYDALDQKAKRTIFKIFVERVRVLEKADPTPLTEEDYADLAKHDLNGRQIKNTVRTAQALAVNKGEALGMRHIRQVLDVLVSFDRDLKGGTGYQEAMRSYF